MNKNHLVTPIMVNRKIKEMKTQKVMKNQKLMETVARMMVTSLKKLPLRLLQLKSGMKMDTTTNLVTE
ncbi:hypothetical protein D3C85_1424750 [compost metagenome]